LGYHRVAAVVRDEYEACVTPEHFAEHMESLRQYAHPLSLSKLVDSLKTGSLPSRAVAVTFDDGYADNLYHARPILEKYQVPATIFITTGYAGREFWWDELERLVMTSQASVDAFRLQVGKSRFVWEQLHGKPEADIQIRREFRHALYHFLLALDTDALDHAMEVIRRWAAATSIETPTRAMNQAELLQLVEGGLIELGSHTRCHPMLPRLSIERQREEITAGKDDLEAVLGKPVHGFAYPNGRSTETARLLVQAMGFSYACTSLQDVVRPDSDLHALTRFWQRNVGGEKFLRGLRFWMNL
jgi:peptidoglycan/xylan/chitin deacetylase (PgdA/CDA1 family)